MMNQTLILNQVKQLTQKELTLFETLQLYDTIIRNYQIPRTSDLALQLYQLLIESYGERSQPTTKAFTSPKRKNNIEDPQLFSFSKATKHVEGESTTQRFGNSMKLKLKSEGIKKNAYPEFSYPPNHVSEVSEFRQFQIQNLNDKENGEYKNEQQKKGKLKLMILKNRWHKLHFQLSREIRRRQKLLKEQSTKYFHQYKLTMKCFKGLQLNFNRNIENEKKADQFLSAKKHQQLSETFGKWFRYAHRSEEEKERQLKIKQNRIILTKKLNFNKFVKNIVTMYEKKINVAELNKVKQDLRRKQEKLRLITGVSRLCVFTSSKKNLQMKEKLVQESIVQKEFKIFIKLLKCKFEVEERKIEEKQSQCLLMRTHVFYSNLRKQTQFQKAYWNNKQKIIFLESLFDAISFRLQRKGYRFDWMETLPQIISNHPAFEEYKRSKLQSYFKNLKELMISNKEKQKIIKYNQGEKVLKGLMLNYRESIRGEFLDQKVTNLTKYYNTKRIKHTLVKMEKNGFWKKKQKLITQQVFKQKVKFVLRSLQAHRISKKYYKERIEDFKSKTSNNLLQTIFLQWKLFTHKEMHNKLIINHFRNASTIKLLQNIFIVLKGNCLDEKLLKRKVNNVRRLLTIERGDQFLSRLIAMKKNGQKQKEQIENKNTSKVQQLRLKNMLRKMVKQTKKRRIQFIIQRKIEEQFKLKLKYKIFAGLKACQQFGREQKEKVDLINQKRQLKLKEHCLNKMVEKLLMNLMLKRMGKILSNKFLNLGFDELLYFSCD